MSKRVYTLFKRILQKPLIPNGSDLNDYLTPGKYRLSALSNYTNVPSGYDGYSAYMKVHRQYNPASSSYTEQRLVVGSNFVTFVRRWSGTAWSSWVTYAGSRDIIVSQGTSGSWTYRKWNSGIAECWMRWQGTVARYGTSGPSPATSMYTKNWDLPFAFTALYSKTATAQVGSGIGIVCSGGLNDKLDTVALHWASNVTSGTSTINLMIKGRWK